LYLSGPKGLRSLRLSNVEHAPRVEVAKTTIASRARKAPWKLTEAAGLRLEPTSVMRENSII
jgi:hypothetical protein